MIAIKLNKYILVMIVLGLVAGLFLIASYFVDSETIPTDIIPFEVSDPVDWDSDTDWSNYKDSND